MARHDSERPKAKYGFASMRSEQVRAISSKGGKSLPDEQRTFARNRNLASEAGQKGGLAAGRNRRQRVKERA